MAKQAKRVDPLEEVKASPSKVTVLWLNPAAASHGGALYDPLPKFPAEILACKNLVELQIFRGITDGRIPEALGALSKLKSLSLGGLDTKKLPDALGELARLETLELAYVEQLSALPASIGKLARLRSLSISEAAIKALPESIGDLRSLKSLTISDCPLRAVPASLWKATAIEELVLPESLKALPPGIRALTKLRSLTLSPQALASIAAELPKLQALVELRAITDFTGTSASELPDELCTLAKLEKLSVAYVGCTRLPAAIGKLANLTALEVGSNKLSTLLDVVAALPGLKTLEYSSNPIAVAERREIDKLMKLAPAKRAAALAKRGAPAPSARPARKVPKLEVIGQVASINSSLSMIIADKKVAAKWRGIGDDPDDSDWERARQALAKKDFAMLDVGSAPAVALTLGIGQGIARVFRIGERVVVVEAFADDQEDALFLEYVASPPVKARSIANMSLPSRQLVVVPSTEPGDGDEALSIDVAPKISLSIEAATDSSWGRARRFFVVPA